MGDEWLSLSGAAKLLGVHPATVRLWSNKGMLPTHRTTGGHRRYRRDEILLWAQTTQQVKSEPDGVMQMAMKNVRLQIGESNLQAEGWYQKLDEAARMEYRQSAHRLFHGLMAYLASKDGDAESEARALGSDYALRARRNQFNEVDAARALLFFRNALVVAMMKVYREANVLSGQAWEEMLHKMHAFTDQILVSLLETYRAFEDRKR